MKFFISIILIAMVGLCAALLFVEDNTKQETARVFVPVAPETQVAD